MLKFVVDTRYIVVFTVAALVACAIALSAAVHDGFGYAPEVAFKTITGENIVLKALRGRPVIVAFWASDCPACIDEMPVLTEWYRRYHERGLEIIAVAMYYDPPSHVVGMAKAKELPYHVALDLHAEQARAFGNVSLIPTTILVDPDGTIVERKTGAVDLNRMALLIEGFLKG